MLLLKITRLRVRLIETTQIMHAGLGEVELLRTNKQILEGSVLYKLNLWLNLSAKQSITA